MDRNDTDISQACLSALVGSTDDAIITTTLDGIITGWNASAIGLFGYAADEILGKSFTLLIPGYPSNDGSGIMAYIKSGRQERHIETVLAGKEGQAVDVSLTVSPIDDGNGGIAGVLTIARDVTRRKKGTDARLRRDRELRTLHRLSEIMLSSRSFEESCRAVAEEICTATGFPVVAVALYDEARQVVVFYGLGPDPNQPGTSGRESSVDDTLTGVVIRTGKPLIATHLRTHPEYKSKSIVRWAQADTFVGYPMRSGETIIGCLNLAHTETIEVDEDTAQWIESLANFLAVLLEQRRNEEELRTSREQLRELSRGIQNAIEEERKRIAREIHDNLGQELSLLQLELGFIQDRLPRAQKELRSKMKSMTKLVDSTIHLVQKISTDLRPTLLDNLGLGAAVEWAARDFQKRTNIHCAVSVDPPDLKLDQDRSTAFFRIMQEALTNVLRHAQATRVDMRLGKREGSVVLEIRDNGIGISSDRIEDPKSVGLTGIRERVRPWQGSVVIHGTPGEGTEIVVTIPVSQ